ncbi:unnamed protein product [Wickerhamomyces anomalus]
MPLKEELIARFGPSIDSPELIRSCQEIINIFTFSVEDLYINWESFIVTKNDGIDLNYTLENLQNLQKYIQSNLVKKNQSKRKLVSPIIKTPAHDSIEPINTPTPLKTQESGKIIESLNSNLQISSGLQDSENHVKLIANFDYKKYQFRTMRTKILETADVLDDQIDSFTKIIQSHYNLSSSVFTNPSIISQSETIAVGRIVPENPTIELINAHSLSLEPSRMIGIGKRVPLDLSNLTNYSFFPGQIVALKGKNASGEYFKVDEILTPPLLGAPVSSAQELANSEDCKIVITSGPYTNSNDLKFDQLESLVEKLNNEINPHVVIMFGPFIDITHPAIIKGDLNFPNQKSQPKSLDDVFKLIISPILKKINNKIQIILIPSLKDSISKHSAYPQDSIDRKFYQLTKNFKPFPNPSIFQINETLIGVSNNDIFKDLKDINKGEPNNINRFDRISNHIIEQRRFYPSFPGSTKVKRVDDEDEYSPTSELDVPYLGLTEFGDVIPDILIIPSDLRFFARVVKNVLVINPGNFMKQNSLGTFVQLSIKKPDLSSLTKIENDLYLHDIWKRARVDIIKT